MHDHGTGVVMDVGRLDAIALGSSRTDTPGMPGARMLGAIHAFAAPESTGGAGVDSIPAGSHDPGDMADGTTTPKIDLRAIKDWLELNPGVRPGQLFDDSAIEAHPTVATKIDEVNGKLTKAETKAIGPGHPHQRAARRRRP